MKGYLMLVAFLGLSIFTFYLLDKNKRENGAPGKNTAPGAQSREELTRTDGYYHVTGADLQSLSTAITGKQIRFRCTILSRETTPVKMVRLTSKDRLLLVNILWQEPDQALDDILAQLQAETIRPGDPVTIFATVEKLEERPTTPDGTSVPNTCSLKSVQKWQRGW